MRLIKYIAAAFVVVFVILAIAHFINFVKTVGGEEYTGDADRQYTKVEIIPETQNVTYHVIYEWDD